MSIKIFVCCLLVCLVCRNHGKVVETRLFEIVDLTWTFNNRTIYWLGFRGFNFTRRIRHIGQNGVWYAVNEFCTSEHGGTHMDAPYHFIEQGWSIEQVPPDRMIARGAFIDLSDVTAEKGAEATLEPTHLQNWEVINGPFEKNTFLLVRFNWAQYYVNQSIYLGIDADNNVHFPGISTDAAEWIVNNTNIVGVGVDTASLDVGGSMNFPVHRMLFRNLIYGVENVKLLLKLPAKGYIVLVMPMKIEEGTGAPARIMAIPEKYSP